MLCALRQMVTPLDGLGAGVEVRDLVLDAISRCEIPFSDVRMGMRDFAGAVWSPTGPTESLDARSIPRRYRQWPDLCLFDNVA